MAAKELKCARALLTFERCRDGTEQEDGRDIKGEPSVAMWRSGALAEVTHWGPGLVQDTSGRNEVPRGVSPRRYSEGSVRGLLGRCSTLLGVNRNRLGHFGPLIRTRPGAPCSLCVLLVQLDLEGRVAGVE